MGICRKAIYFFCKNKLFIDLVKKIQWHSNRFLQKVEALKDIAAELLTRTVKHVDEALNDGSLTEICDDQKS